MSFPAPSQPADRAALIGILLMLCVAVLGAIDAVIVRHLSPEVHPFIMVFTRGLFGCLLILPAIALRPGVLQSHYRWLHGVRAALKLASLIAFFVAYAAAPLADVTAIAFTAPIFVTIGAWLFLSEAPRALRIAAVIVGFLGVLLVLRPGDGGVSPGLIAALIGAFLTAVIQLLLKPMSGRDSTQTLVVWNLLLTVPLAAIPAFLVWQTPTLSQWGWLVAQGAIGMANMTLVTRAFAMADASLLVPIEFLRLPVVAILAFAVFGQSVAGSTWIGALAIFVAVILMARSARARRSPMPPSGPP